MLERLVVSGSDQTIRRRRGAFAVSLALHGASLLALLCLLQRIVMPVPPAEPGIAMVFEAAAPPASAPAEPAPAPAPPQESAPPEPAPQVAATPLPSPPVEQAEPLLALPEQKTDKPAPAERPRPKQVTAAPRPHVPTQETQQAASAAAPVSSAVSAVSLVPARPVAGMESDRPPVYPEIARRRGEQGRVVLQVNVSAQGLPVAVNVAESSGFPTLDSAALTAVQRWRFVPATRGGTPVPAVAEVPVRFRLTN